MSRSVMARGSSENRLLAALPGGDFQRLCTHLRHVTLSPGDVLYESGGLLDYVYFPTNSIVSLLYTMENGGTAEMGIVGNDGVVGVALFLGGDTTPNRAVVQVAGHAFKIMASAARQEFARDGPFQQLVLRYTQAFITQISQTAVCNDLHCLEKRLCRWLLLVHDRMESDELVMTHEFLSSMLGGRRESVTAAAGRLQHAGLIHYARGHVKILDRKGLEATACECYQVVKDECARLLGTGYRREVRGQRQSGAERPPLPRAA